VQEGRVSHRDALMEYILTDPRIAALCDVYMAQLHSVAERPAFRGAIAEHTPAEHPQQRQGPATRVLVGATRGGGGQAPAGPGTPAAVTTLRAPRRVRAQ
jgi:hypothetical protein